MANAGTLSVDVQARITDFTNNLRQAETRADAFAARLSKVGKANYFAPMQETLKGMSRDFKQIIQGIVLAQTFYTGLQLFKQLAAAVYEYTDALDYAKVTFSNLFRDASLGEEFVYVLQQYAARSPFDFTDIEKGARQLAAYGIQAKNLMFIMQGIGNLSAVTGDPQTFDSVSRAIGQIYAKGKLSAEEMRQLAEAGLNVKAVYERLGVDADTVANANISAAEAINAVIDVLNENYAGAMKAANMTMRGMIGNIKDVLLSTVSAVYEPSYKRLQQVLLGFQQQLDKFQQTFSTAGLKAAIEEAFGPEILQRIQQFIAICQMLGNTIYQLLVPALQIFAMYGQSVVAVIGMLGRVVLPLIQALAALLNSLLQNAQAVRILQIVLLALAVMKVVGGFAKFLQGTLGLLTTQIGRVINVVSVASKSMQLFRYSMQQGATVSVAAGNAFRYFTACLKANPIIMIISLVLSLIAALVGLRSLLGMTSDGLSELSNVDTSKIFEGIKMGTGDIEKFNQRLDDTGEAVDDINNGLGKTKKRQKDLLSFDEVFRLPESDSGGGSGGSGDAGAGDVSFPDVGDFELPEIEPLDWSDLFPNLNTLFDWLSNLSWDDLAAAIANAIIAGLSKPWKKFWTKLKKLPQSTIKMLEKSAIKALPPAIEKIITKTEPLVKYVKELPGQTYKSLKALPAAIERPLSKAAKPITKFKGLLEGAFDDTFKKLPGKTYKELKLLPAAVEKTISKNMSTPIVKALEDIPEQVSKSPWYKKLAKVVTDNLSKFKGLFDDVKISNPFKGLTEISLPKLSFNPDGVFGTLLRDLDSFKTGFKTAWSNLVADLSLAFDEKSLQGIKQTIKTFFSELGKSFDITIIGSAFAKIDFSGLFTAFTKSLKEAFKPANIKNFLKTGVKDFGLTLIGEFLFDQLAQWLRDNGMKEAAVFAENFGGVLASGLATFIVTKNPFAAIGGAIVTAIIESLTKGIEEGDWSSFIVDMTGGLSFAISRLAASFPDLFGRIFPKALKGGGFLAVGGIISDMLFDSIAENMRANGDENGAAIVEGIGSCVSGALTGASIGMLFGPIGALAGAIIGALVQFLAEHWEQVVDWWCNVVVPWFEALPENIANFFIGVGTWLVDTGKMLIEGLWNGICFVWETICNFFINIGTAIANFFIDAGKWLWDAGCSIINGLWEGICSIWETVCNFFIGIGTAIANFFIGAGQWLWDAGCSILNGLWEGICNIWNGICEFFMNIGQNIINFFAGAGQWLWDAGCSILNGLWDGICSIWNGICDFFGNIGNNICNFFSNAGQWLFDAGANILQGFWDGICSIWDGVCDFFSGVGDWIVEHKGPESYDKNLLVNAGTWIMEGFQNGLNVGFNKVQEMVSNVGPRVQNKFNNAPTLLTNAGNQIMTGLSNALNQTAPVTNAIQIGISQIVSAFSGAGTLLTNAGTNIVSGLASGVQNSNALIGAVHSVLSTVSSAFSNSGTLLYYAGQNIMYGLHEGMIDYFYRYTIPALRSMGETIQRNKGPEDYDKNLLVENGEWIIEGLQVGLLDSFKNVLQSVQSFGPQMQAAFATPSLSVGRADAPGIGTTPTPAPDSSQSEVVANPYLNSATDTADASQRPILYVGTLIADKQGLRELQKKLDIVNAERNRNR